MANLIIAEINQYLIKTYSVSTLLDHINSLSLDGIAPSFAEKPHNDFVNQLQALTSLPLWLPQESTYPHNEGNPRYVPVCDGTNLQFLRQGSEKTWQNITPSAPEKHEAWEYLKGYLADQCNKNVAILAPLAITPVLIALRSIQRFDPYLCKHYLKQFEPTLDALNPALAEEILKHKLSAAISLENTGNVTPSEGAAAYLRLERKLHRQYKEHG